jgi:periplasmic protein TonB
MSNVSIFEKKWIDLVFEGKNKEYGAYQLRQENSKTTTKAFFYAIGSIGLVSGIVLLFSSFKSDTTPDVVPIDGDPIIVVDVTLPPETKKPEQPRTEPEKPVALPVETPAINTNYVVAPTAQANPVVPTNNELPTTNPSTGGTEPGTGTTVPSGGTGGGDDDKPTAPAGPVMSAALDAQPEFPGGMKKFYAYVGDNFEKQEIDGEESLTVHVSFVIEKDGSMTDIRVVRNPGYGLDKEAIRVLKSLKTKWKPGVLNGQNVRTQYSLPIKVMVNQ